VGSTVQFIPVQSMMHIAGRGDEGVHTGQAVYIYIYMQCIFVFLVDKGTVSPDLSPPFFIKRLLPKAVLNSNFSLLRNSNFEYHSVQWPTEQNQLFLEVVSSVDGWALSNTCLFCTSLLL
jgi:hypothetical protein